MLLVDAAIVNVALPGMAVDLHTSFSSLQWVIDSYAVVLAALLMGLGSVADLSGRRRVYLAGLNAAFLLAGALGLTGAVIVLAAMRRRPAPPPAAQAGPAQPGGASAGGVTAEGVTAGGVTAEGVTAEGAPV